MTATTAARTAEDAPLGTAVAKGCNIVPMRPTDGPRLERFHEGLSPQSTYLRFFAFHPRLSASEVDRFVNVDHRGREALVATIGDELIGVGRYERLGDGLSAEIAFIVADASQGHGVGRALFDELARRARAVGITTFVAEVLPHNHRMLGLFRDTGLTQTRQFRDGTVYVEIRLEPADDHSAQSARVRR